MTNWTKEEIEHIEDTADEYGVDYETAYVLAETLGRSELFDGLVSILQDYECFM